MAVSFTYYPINSPLFLRRPSPCPVTRSSQNGSPSRQTSGPLAPCWSSSLWGLVGQAHRERCMGSSQHTTRYRILTDRVRWLLRRLHACMYVFWYTSIHSWLLQINTTGVFLMKCVSVTFTQLLQFENRLIVYSCPNLSECFPMEISLYMHAFKNVLQLDGVSRFLSVVITSPLSSPQMATLMLADCLQSPAAVKRPLGVSIYVTVCGTRV